MRYLALVIFAWVCALAPGCINAPPVQVERRTFPLGAGGPIVPVVGELRYYLVEETTTGSAASELKVIKKDRRHLICSVAGPMTLLQTPDTTSAFNIRGFVLQVVEPPEYAGEVLTAHFDGPLASGDPFKGFAPGKRYQMEVAQKLIGDLYFGLCY